MDSQAKKKFGMPNTFTIIYILIVLVALLTWILPAGEFDQVYDETADRYISVSGTYHQVESQPQGIKDILLAFFHGLVGASEVIAFVLIVGGAYGVVIKTGAIENGLNQVIRKFSHNAILIIPILMFLFSLGGTTTGMWEETLPFFIITIPLMMALGYDPIVGIALIILGAGSGTLASTVNPFSTGIASGIAGIDIKDGLGLRVVIYVLSVASSIVYVMWYASKIKKDPTRSLVYYRKKEHEEYFLGNLEQETQKESVFRTSDKVILLAFFLMILSMIYGVIAFDWYMGEITMLFLILALVSALFSKMKDNDFWDAFIEGSKDLLSAALIIGLARGIVVIAQDGMILATILEAAVNVLKHLHSVVFVVLNYIFQLAIGFLIPSSSGHAALVMPIMAPLGELLNIPKSIIVTTYQSASGLINWITPTGGIVMAAIGIAKISYSDWLKFVMPLFIIQMVIVSTVLIIGLLIKGAIF